MYKVESMETITPSKNIFKKEKPYPQIFLWIGHKTIAARDYKAG